MSMLTRDRPALRLFFTVHCASSPSQQVGRAALTAAGAPPSISLTWGGFLHKKIQATLERALLLKLLLGHAFGVGRTRRRRTG